MAYRETRNIEASIIDYLKTELASAWSGVSVEKSFSQVYDATLPVVCVRLGPTSHNAVEIGTNSLVRSSQLLIDTFAENDGQKLDLTDFLVTKLKNSIDYYEYVIEHGTVKTKTKSGKIRINRPIEVTFINFNEDKDQLDAHDKFRSLITVEVTIGKVE